MRPCKSKIRCFREKGKKDNLPTAYKHLHNAFPRVLHTERFPSFTND